MEKIFKYPRTRHLEGSKLQEGDEDLSQVPWTELTQKNLVVEEKIDGANAGISFDGAGDMFLQCRGHFLTGGAGEKQFNLFKQWAAVHERRLLDLLEDRYIMYGEWMYAKHTVFYDALPHYFMEFDVYDKERGVFLSTHERRRLLDRAVIEPVRVLAFGRFDELEEVLDCLGRSAFKSAIWRKKIEEIAENNNLDLETIWRQTDKSDLMEGLYIKWEEDGIVKGRYKWIRADFLQAILESGDHWKARPILPNQLRQGTDIFKTEG